MSQIPTQFFRKMTGSAQAPADKEVVEENNGRRRKRISSSEWPAVTDGRANDLPVDPLLARLILSYWNRFFRCFRSDELAMEFPRYQEEASDVFAAVEALGDKEHPDLNTCQKMMFLLSRFNRERFLEWNDRIDELKEQGKQLESKLHAVEIDSSVTEDELRRCLQVLNQAAKQHDLEKPEENGTGVSTAIAEKMLDEMSKDRQALDLIANAIDRASWEKLPIEAQMHLNFFRK